MTSGQMDPVGTAPPVARPENTAPRESLEESSPGGNESPCVDLLSEPLSLPGGISGPLVTFLNIFLVFFQVFRLNGAKCI